MYPCCVTLLVALLPQAAVTLTEAVTEAKRLYEELLIYGDYNKLIRPVGNTTDQLTIVLSLQLTQIVDVVSTSVPYVICIYCTIVP